MTDLVMRLSAMSPIDGYMATSLSATYHCAAAVPATALTTTLGTRYGNARMMEHTRLVPFAPPNPMTPEIWPLTNPSSNSFFPPSAIAAAASWRERSLSACQDAPAAAATLAPVTSAPSTSCDFKDKSTTQGVAPARTSISATNRASLPLVFRVANTAMVGFDALKTIS